MQSRHRPQLLMIAKNLMMLSILINDFSHHYEYSLSAAVDLQFEKNILRYYAIVVTVLLSWWRLISLSSNRTYHK